MEELAYWVAFSRVPGVGRVRFSQLEAFFGNLKSAWSAPAEQLRQAGLDSRTVSSIVSVRSRISPEQEMEHLASYSVQAITCADASYPSRLKEIHDYPPVIYVRGKLLPADLCCVAVVGTRGPTMYGKQVTVDMVGGLVRAGVTIVSGLARGIDSIAHRSALESGGRTIAVLAGGLDNIYPAENVDMARRVMENGALISEYPIGIRPKPDNFPRRNRIMSGMSLGVLVVEAGETSGAIVTARQAIDQNREVFAVPGTIVSPMSKGTNMLIQRSEAKLVVDYTDILAELNLSMVAEQMEMKEVLAASDAESVLLAHVSAEPAHIDEICRRSGLRTSEVASALALMELKGVVRQLGGMNYVLAKR
ncbi:MAG: DNA-protecting protein DprA [Chloroflexi bacterium]|nr:DNA-protecting protein DprA [Chloroflexota bacterium]